MPRATIDYMNARKAAKAASGGTNYRARECAQYAPDYEPDAAEIALSAISGFALWAECSRARYLAANGQSIADVDAAQFVDEIPF